MEQQQIEGQKLLEALQAQRDNAMNMAAQLDAAVRTLSDKLATAQERIAELEKNQKEGK